ncbi:hypothetical protein Tco_1085102 [Tanacetum coccineum]
MLRLLTDCYIRPPWFRTTIEHISDEPGSIAANRTKKILLLTWHKSSEPTKEHVCDFVTPSSLPQHDSSTLCKVSVCDSITPRCMPNCMLTPPTDESAVTYAQLSGVHGVIDDVIRHLSFEETKLDGEAGFADIARNDVESSGLSHDESFRVDDLDFNLNKPVNLNGSQIETQSKLFVFEEPDVGRSHEPIVVEVSTQEPIVAEVRNQIPIVEEVGTQEFTVEDVVLEDYVSYKFLALGWHLEEIHATWAHLKKKRTRLRLYIKNHEELCIQCVETMSPS